MVAPERKVFELLNASAETSARSLELLESMLIAWLLTLPAAGCTAGLVYAFMRLFGTGAAGPIVVAVLAVVGLAVVGLAVVFARRARTAAPAPVTPEAPA